MDLRVTTAGLPTVQAAGVSYPLFFAVLDMKRFAEHRGQTFEEVLEEGWSILRMPIEDTAMLLRIGLEAGEKRRHLCDGGDRREISDALVARILDSFHPLDLGQALAEAWNGLAGREPDPPTPEADRPVGEPYSD